MVPGLLYNPRKKMNARLLLLDYGLISAKFQRSFQIAGVSITGTTTINKTVSSIINPVLRHSMILLAGVLPYRHKLWCLKNSIFFLFQIQN